MRPTILTVGPLAAPNATGIALAQAVAGAGNLTLNGAFVANGVATLDTPRRVIITSAGNDSGISFTITGQMFRYGPIVSETLKGANAGAAQSVLDYATITRISASGAAAGNVSVGTDGVASSRWMFLDDWGDTAVSLQVIVDGTVNYTVEQTLDDPNGPLGPSAVTWLPHPVLQGQTTDQQDSYPFKPKCCRLTLNSGSGAATMTVIQAFSPFRI